MPWFDFNLPWTDTIKKKVCRYLLQRYLGQFLEDSLKLDQLNVDFYNGKGTVEFVKLSCKALNDICEDQGWDVSVTSGFIGSVFVNIPWNAPMTEDSYIEVGKLCISLKPVKRHRDPGTSMLESMWSSMSSSMQLAQDCLEKEGDSQGIPSQTIDGLERFAQLIDNVLNRVKAKLTDTTVKIDVPAEKSTSMKTALFIHIDSIEYENEAGESEESRFDTHGTHKGQGQDMYYFPTFSSHQIKFSGITVYTEEKTSKMEKILVENDHDENTNECSLFDMQNAVPVLNMTSEQSIRLKMKQASNLAGPKVELEATIGPILIFLSPRQLHLLVHLCTKFLCPETEETSPKESNEMPFDNIVCEPSLNMFNSTINSSSFNQGWSSAQENSDNLNFASCNTNSGRNLGDSFLSSNSSVNSSVSSFGYSQCNKPSKKQTDFDTDSIISHFKVRIACLTTVLLHEDILQNDSATSTVTGSSISKLKEKATSFFTAMEGVHKNAIGVNDMHKISSRIQQVVEFHNLRVILTPLIIEGNEQKDFGDTLLTTSITIARANIVEDLNTNIIQIFSFINNDYCSSLPSKPELQVCFVQSNKLVRTRSRKKIRVKKLKSTITISPCVADVDISIIDRLSALLFTKPFDSVQTQMKNETSCSENEVELLSEYIELKVRFPITDLRPVHDPQRSPWWTRNIREDFMTIICKNLQAKSIANQMTYLAESIELFYYENDHANPTMVAHLASEVLKNQEKELVKIFIGTSFNDAPSSKKNVVESVSSSSRKPVTSKTTDNSSPFSSKRVLRDSETNHNRQTSSLPEIFVVPGDNEELNRFSEYSFKLANIQIDVVVPQSTIEFKSKQLYEVLYNRINSDLLLWQPNAPVASQPSGRLNNMKQNILDNRNELDEVHLRSMRQETLIGSSSSSTSSEHEKKKTDTSEECAARNDVCLKISFGTIKCILNTPLKDELNQVIPQQKGCIAIVLNKSELCIVSGLNGDPNKSAISFKSQSFELFHLEAQEESVSSSIFRGKDNFFKHLYGTIYLTPNNLSQKLTHLNSNREMLSLAVQIKKNPEQKIKRIRLTVGIQQATLRHRVVISQHSWLNQLIDMFDVEEFTVNGYNPSNNITELHLHLWDCSVDYRPLRLPYRAIVTCSTFMISSNISTVVSGSTLRFIAEDCTLSLAQFNPEEQHDNTRITVLPSDQLVCVSELGLFEISLKLMEQATSSFPKYDLRAALNDAHIRTCADSGQALASLISYLASELDLHGEEKASFVETELPNGPEVDEKPTATTILEEHQNVVTDLLTDAMEEEKNLSDTVLADEDNMLFSFTEERAEKRKNSQTQRMWFESNSPVSSVQDLLDIEFETIKEPALLQESDQLPQVKDELGSILAPLETDYKRDNTLLTKADAGSSSDEDFYFVSMEEDITFKEEHFADHTNFLVDHHFVSSKLSPNVPMTINRYTLCELSIVWHLHGGYDFATTQDKSGHESEANSEVHFSRSKMSDAYKLGVSYSKGGLSPHNKTWSKLTWRTRGGINRKQDVLMDIIVHKVRFINETFSSNSEQASRQILLVTDFEIRDRLAVSNINKFLYHPQPTPRPKGSEYVFVLKAIHLRPNPALPTTECCLRISMLPVRLNIDQDSLLFLIEYFTELSGIQTVGKADMKQKNKPQSYEDPPVMMVELPEAAQELRARKMVSKNLSLLIDEDNSYSDETCSQDSNSSSPIYFRSVLFSPEVPIQFDYHGKRFELSHGPIAGLIMGLGQMQCSRFTLKRISYRQGILGVEKLWNHLLQEWLQDIKRKQLPKILGGVGPVYSFVQLFQGIFDLVRLPIEQYQKDGRIVKGFQRGCQSFTARTALATLEITTRLIYLLQVTAETAYDMFSPGPSLRRQKGHRNSRKKQQQPQDIREGVANAYQIVKEGLVDTAHQLVEIAVLEHDHKGAIGAVGAVLRQIPPTAVRPIVLATQATSNVLGGVKNQLIPEARTEAKDKWKQAEE